MPSVTPPSRPRATSPDSAEAGSPKHSLHRFFARMLARLPRVQIPWPRSPRTRAALCYAIPLAPALALLLRERHSLYVRLHAARALLFFVLILLAQTVLLVWLVVLGNLATARWLAVLLGLLFYFVVPTLGLIILISWLRCLTGALTGRAIPLTHLDRAARWLERHARPRQGEAIAAQDGAQPHPAPS
ncbi:MAG TPA: hypothetical protein VFY89_02890 [Ktedonobacterales bacterium]